MEGMFDIQKEYENLIVRALQLLNKEGVLYFSTNSRKFRFDETLFSEVSVEEITEKTIPDDFRLCCLIRSRVV